MKTEIEILGFEIEVKEEDGKVTLVVEKGDEVIEEITLDPAEYEGGEDGEDVKDFDSFEGEGEEGEELPEGDNEDDEDEDEDEDDNDEDVLESFDKWTSKKKKK